ncbi:MAG: cytochrome B [gamma proteobacterium symbiont of Ctena orbiculata]|uniref:Cytochrome b/b6 domain-containing protein n=1 Tax=Candidatus Thiodiazotropha taylori TaxID=2792791 RepID=A0A944MB87_9GAMM|nr:cytochrome b/b6 domain-containing protein [Candidatus Thiodiazotropha taylori]PUB88659.1 MAG: cytochrome B [gamma proteobacterium symbiont of Ctena orbiculata]MBT2990187.1 cytochrome b/b6 domain-containing protein [Candidatus Thiodiazotropha taylori]MBT2998341.1 cytochrome b/b6 domain-containing protein [Candidatus Thiodiazotropha taylori]MBT3000368.1 cytochrome b/b6 domain-containing protein [Candidatus Thiodiazotropha taylori]
MKHRNEIKVWDPLVRLFHWTLVGAFTVAWLTEDDWMALHAYAGYVIGFLLLFRLIWGLLGTRYARFSDFVRPPSRVAGYLFDLVRLRAERTIGHNPAGGAMIVALLITLLITTFTGLLAYGATGAGPLADLLFSNSEYGSELFEEVHEFFANFTLSLVVLHLLGVAFGSLLHGENLVQAMITGTKRA